MKKLLSRVTVQKKDLARVGAPVLVLALVASVVTGREQPAPAVVEPAARIDTRLEADRASAEAIDLAKLNRAELASEAPAVDPFSRRSFAPPAPAAQQAEQAPAKPVAPPLPFTYVGKMIEDGKLTVFLARGDESLTVAAGQKIGADYRVDQVTEQGITFTYLPMKKKQELHIGAADQQQRPDSK